jgi:hypothetical protein
VLEGTEGHAPHPGFLAAADLVLDFGAEAVICVFTFRVSSLIVVNGSANRMPKTQEGVPGGFSQVFIGVD